MSRWLWLPPVAQAAGPPTRRLPLCSQALSLSALRVLLALAQLMLQLPRSLPLPLRELVSRAAATDSPALRATVREMELRVALERVKRDEQRARAELARWQTRKEQRQRFEEHRVGACA